MTHFKDLGKALFLSAVLLAGWMARAGAAPAGEPLVLAFGDSLTAGYELPASDAYPARLEALLRKGGLAVRVHNAGVSGDTTAAGRARLTWVLAALKRKPDLVILALGGNDALRGLPPAATRTHLDAMLAELKRRGIPVLLAGMLAPPNLGKDYGRAFNAIYPDLARRHGVSLYPFLLDGVAGRPALQLADGLHPNARGAQLMAGRIAPKVRAALAR